MFLPKRRFSPITVLSHFEVGLSRQRSTNSRPEGETRCLRSSWNAVEHPQVTVLASRFPTIVVTNVLQFTHYSSASIGFTELVLHYHVKRVVTQLFIPRAAFIAHHCLL